ncbi:MAG: CotH kinase family protein [Clostridia bacterium]|nr:CotH kinase family protein [Clostridia bacterium]
MTKGKMIIFFLCALLCSATSVGAYSKIHTTAVDWFKSSHPYPVWSRYEQSAVYTIPNEYDPALNIRTSAELPKVRLTGNIVDMSKYSNRPMQFKYDYKESHLSGYAAVSLQGNSSLNYRKKSFSIKLFTDRTHDVEYKPSFGNWYNTENYILKANWIDYTGARNIVASRLYKKMPNAMLPNGTYGIPDGFPVKLYINNSYRGLYTIVQPKKKKLFGLKDKDAVNGARLYSAEKKDGSAVFENSSALDDNWECKFPADHFDKTALNRLTEFVSSCTYEEFKTYASHYMDINSLINYIVFSEITMNADGWQKNYNIVTYDGKLWYIRPYDLDCTFGLDFAGNISESAYTDPMKDWINTTRLWTLTKACFPQEIYQRYLEVRHGALTEDAVMNEFKEFIDKVGTETYMNENTIWNRRGNIYDSFAQIKDYIKTRYAYLDEYMPAEFDHPSYFPSYKTKTVD